MEKRLGIYKECVEKKTHRIFYGLGIGYPQKGRPRNQFDDYELAIGASNGHNLTVKKPTDPDYPDKYPNSPTPVNPVKPVVPVTPVIVLLFACVSSVLLPYIML